MRAIHSAFGHIQGWAVERGWPGVGGYVRWSELVFLRDRVRALNVAHRIAGELLGR